MSAPAPPIIAFELGVGEFRIVTPEAVYQIKVCPDLVEATRKHAESVESPAPGTPVLPAASFFQEISEELFDKVGRLARRLSVSVEELPEQLTPPDLDQTDKQLENAKGQLEEIVKITEKASMTIMDMADQIQTDMDQLKSQLDILQNLDLMAAEAEGAPLPTSPESAPPPVELPLQPIFFDKLEELKDFVGNLMANAASATIRPEMPLAPEPKPAAPPAQTVTVVNFDVDVVFQTLYELCTNESVKDHIKLMREAQAAAFKAGEIADKLTEMAPTVDEEDGFYNFPIPLILKTLYAATGSEDFRTTLKKMNQTAASIFLDSVLPIEGEKMEVEIPASAAASLEEVLEPPSSAAPDAEIVAAPGGPAGCSLEELRTIQDLAAEIGQLGLTALAGPPSPAESAAIPAPGLYTPILTQDRDTIIKTVNLAHKLIHQTGGHLTRILETLSFQDLSGQRIMKVIALLGDIQMQLLSILVSVDAKMKMHRESGGQEVKAAQAEQMAQAEVDRALEKLAGDGSALAGPGAEARLDQHAVNDLLAQLGF